MKDLTERDEQIWADYLLYQSLRPKVNCKKYDLTYSGYEQALWRIKKAKEEDFGHLSGGSL